MDVEIKPVPDPVLVVLTGRPCSPCAQQVFTRSTPLIGPGLGVSPVVTPPISFCKLIDLVLKRLPDAITVIAVVLA